MSVDQGVTVFRTSGVISSHELAVTIGDFYGNAPTRLVLWDNREADFSTISSTELQNLAQIPAEAARLRPNARTATVVSDDFHHGLARMSDAYLETAQAPTGLAIFRSYEEAMAWLLRGDTEPSPDAEI